MEQMKTQRGKESQLMTVCQFVINFFYIHGYVHRNSRLKKSNEMQQYADIYLLLN